MSAPRPHRDQRAVAVPVLPVADLLRSAAWYERLGFTIHGVWDDYVILDFEGAEVHLAQLGDEGLGQPSWSGAYLRVADADALHARWRALGAHEVMAPTDQPYGIREFATEDLDHNLWRVGSPLAASSSEDPDVDIADVADVDAAELRADEHGSAPTPGGSGDGVPRTDGGPGTDESAWFDLVASGARCAGCGLDTGDLPARALGAQVRDEVHAFGELLAAADDEAVRRRPGPGWWSALECGVHVRDLLSLFAERVVRVLAADEPDLGWWDQDAAIDEGMANEADVAAVVDDLGRNASKLSESLRMAGDDDWQRVGIVGGSVRFTVELLARVALHETVHHRADAEAALAAALGDR